MEGAVQVVQSALRNGDRAGVVTLGGSRPRWLGPDIGQRQFYRVLDAVLGVSGRQVSGTLAPQAAVPPGAVVVVGVVVIKQRVAQQQQAKETMEVPLLRLRMAVVVVVVQEV